MMGGVPLEFPDDFFRRKLGVWLGGEIIGRDDAGCGMALDEAA
jgi:hypothetical protein